jgi:hypothetical protein
MLNGIDPIIIFQFSKSLPQVSEALAKIPIVSQIPTLVDAPPIPIYLSEKLTGILIDAESKNIDAETTTESKSDGSAPAVDQKTLASTVSIELTASKNSLGVTLLAAMADLAFEKLTSKEYSITYLHGAVTIFRGQLHSFSISQNANDTKYSIKIEISKGGKTPQKTPDVPVVPKTTGAVPL